MMRQRDRPDPAETKWLRRVFELADLHPTSVEERDRRVAETLQHLRAVDMSEVAVLRAINRAAGTSPELDEAVRLLGLYVERLRDGGRRLPKPGLGGVRV